MPDGNNTVRAKPGSRLRELGLVPPKSPTFLPRDGARPRRVWRADHADGRSRDGGCRI